MRQEAVEQGRRLAAEELLSAAEELLTIMAHDLRNYLTPLKGRLELLERRAPPGRAEQNERDATAGRHNPKKLGRGISGPFRVGPPYHKHFYLPPHPPH